MNLPAAVRYKPRQTTGSASRPNISAETLIGRSYADFCALDVCVQASCVEMDCVCGIKTDTHALLTLYWRAWRFQLALLLDRHNSSEVTRELDCLERSLLEAFPDVALTDRGPEFSQADEIETAPFIYTEDGRRCSLYYCDPGRSDQKGGCENAHRLIRRIIPKGTSLDALSEEQIALMVSHVNSMPRTSLGGRPAMSLAMEHLPEQFFADYCLKLIDPEKIVLKPHLFGNC